MAREHNIWGGGVGGVNNVCLASELVSRLWEERAIVSNSTDLRKRVWTRLQVGRLCELEQPWFEWPRRQTCSWLLPCVYCFAFLVMRSPSRAILCLRRSSKVDACYLDSVMESLCHCLFSDLAPCPRFSVAK